MKDDIINYSPTVMFRGTPCIYESDTRGKAITLAEQNKNFEIKKIESFIFLSIVSSFFYL